MNLHHDLLMMQLGLDRIAIQPPMALAKIVVHGAPPAPKELCLKAQARGIPCTTDKCDHSGGYIVMMFSDGEGRSDTNQGACKACGADPEPTRIFD